MAACRLSLVAAKGGYPLAVVCGLLLVASPLWSVGSRALRLQQLWCVRSVVSARGLKNMDPKVVVHGLSCLTTRSIFPDLGFNPSSLHW